MKIQSGTGSTDASGDATVTLSGFTGTPVFLVSCSQTDVPHHVNGFATSASSATVKSWFKNTETAMGPINFSSVAVGQ